MLLLLGKLEKITKPYIKPDAVESQVGINYSRGISYCKHTDGISANAFELAGKLVRRANAINSSLARIIKDVIYVKKDDIVCVDLSAGKFRAVETFLDTVGGKEEPSVINPANIYQSSSLIKYNQLLDEFPSLRNYSDNSPKFKNALYEFLDSIKDFHKIQKKNGNQYIYFTNNDNTQSSVFIGNLIDSILNTTSAVK